MIGIPYHDRILYPNITTECYGQNKDYYRQVINEFMVI